MSPPLALSSQPTATSRHSRQRCTRLLHEGRATLPRGSGGSGGGGTGGPTGRSSTSVSYALNRPRQALVRTTKATSQQEAQHGTVVLDLLLPGIEPSALAEMLFRCCLPRDTLCGQAAAASSGGSSDGLLIHLLQHHLGCTELAVGPWSITDPGSSSSGSPAAACTSAASSSSDGGGSCSTIAAERSVSYSMPLSRRQRLLLPLGPAAVPSREEQRVRVLPGGGLEARCRCTSAGVPFADCFDNVMHWQLLPAGGGGGGGGSAGSTAPAAGRQPAAPALRPAAGSPGSSSPGCTRLLLTARCHFHRPVLGPLRGQIERESLQGVKDAYSQLAGLLAEHCGTACAAGSAAGAGSPRPVGNASSASCLSSSLELPNWWDAPQSGADAASGSDSSSDCPGDSSSEGSFLSDSTSDGGADGAYAEWLAARDLARKRLTATTVEGVLEQIAALWPEWTAAGCPYPEDMPRRPALAPIGAAAADRLQARAPRRPQVRAPSAAEAVAALRALALRAFHLPVPDRRQLPKHRLVRGLLRALRLELEGGGPPSRRAAPSRLAPAAISRALWALGRLGGSIFFEPEVDALCSMLPNEPMHRLSHVEDATWALALMRHYTPHLPLLEEWAVELLQWQLEVTAAAQEQAGAAVATQEQTGAAAATQEQAGADAPPGEVPAAATGSTAGGAGGSGEGSSGGGEGSGGAASSAGGEGSGGAYIDDGTDCSKAPPSAHATASMLWALATLGHQPTALLDLLPAVLRSRWGPSVRPAAAPTRLRRACGLGWSLAAAGCLGHPAVAAVAEELAAAAAAVSPKAQPGRASLLQLHQFFTALELEAAACTAAGPSLQAAEHGTAAGAALPYGPPAQALRLLRGQPTVVALLQLAAAAWEDEGRRGDNKRVSACQADVAATARGGLGLAVNEEYSLAGISIDIAVPSRRLAIEVDGPTHFCRNGSQGDGQAAQPRPLGGTLLKRRLIEGQGWRVASINVAQWEALRGSLEKRQVLKEAIAAAQVQIAG